MFDMSQPIGMEVIIGSVVFIIGLVGLGLATVAYYKRKLNITKVEEEK